MKFRTKPIEVLAVQWTGDNSAELSELCKDKVRYLLMSPVIPVVECAADKLSESEQTRHKVNLMDWVVKDARAEPPSFAVIDHDRFRVSFEPVL